MPPPEEQLREAREKWEKQIQQDIRTVERLQFSGHIFFGGLFIMVLPDSLLEEKEELAQGELFYSHKEKVALAIRLVEDAPTLEPDKLKADYTARMKSSGQQTGIEEDGTVEAQIGTIYYFLASHAMPGEKQYDYVFLFSAQRHTVIMDFSFHEPEMMLWKTMLYRLIKTIR